MGYLLEEVGENTIHFPELLSDVSSNLVNVPSDEINSALNSNLLKLLKFFNVKRVALWQIEPPEGRTFVLTHVQGNGGSKVKVNSVLPADSISWIYRQYARGHQIQYSQIDDLPEIAINDRITLHKFGSDHAAIGVPLFNGKKLLGILALGNSCGTTWPTDAHQKLRVVADILATTIMRHRMQDQLHHTVRELEAVKAQLQQENIILREKVELQFSPSRIVYKSQAMSDVLKKAMQVAPTTATVLIIGETGTGKEMLASAIHSWSPRASRTMVRVNCGAIPGALVESEMFGREKGAYTGALTRQIGRFELANDSTIFLDEITELPLELQVKLLRVLQEKEIERLGNPKPIAIDSRVIAATNQGLEKLTRDGKFRDDLFYRLNVFPIHIPPLRERPEDIPLLVWSIVDELSSSLNKQIESISQKSMEDLTAYSWPGNVRELRNTIERAIIVCNSEKLTIELPGVQSNLTAPNLYLKEMQVQHIRRVLETTSWRIRGKNGAAEILGLKPTTLETRMAKLGILRPKNDRPQPS